MSVVPAALCALLLLAADPRGDFPVNDDFQWADAAFRLAAGGGLRLGELVVASAVAHVALGAVPVLLFGPSDWVLRVWTMAWGCAAASAVFLLARRFGARPAAALAAGCALAADPLHLLMSASFHMEVTMMAGVLLAAWGLLVHLETGSRRALAACGAGLAFAALTRQTAAVGVLGPAALLAARGRLGRAEAALLLGPVLAAMAGWQAWLRWWHGPTWGSQALTPAWAGAAEAARDLQGALWTMALLAFPAAAGGARAAWARGRPARAEAGALLLVLLAWLEAVWRGGLPLLGNLLTRAGLGVVTLNDPSFKESGWWRHPGLWAAADLAALASALALVRLLWPRPERAWAALSLAAAPVLGAAVLTDNFDRYLLAWLPLVLLAAVWAAGKSFRPVPAAAAVLAFGLVSTAGLRDYFAWNRARWEAGLRAVRAGVPAEKVENGFDWDGRLTLDRNLRRLRERRPAREIGRWDWMTLNRIVALTSFSPRPPRPSFVLVDSVPYRTPLAPGERRVYLHALREAVR